MESVTSFVKAASKKMWGGAEEKTVEVAGITNEHKLPPPKGIWEQRIENAAPLLLASCLVWPIFWTLRGYNWKNARNLSTLRTYIQKTHIQAKALTFGIISGDIIHNLFFREKETTMLRNVNNENDIHQHLMETLFDLTFYTSQWF
ncbi:uncharacterized protein LOC119672336 isoform X2 [Teleopsis dalmanni]|nr:uncharacterized protein LOC119672336 isoform X2 [Teleopsis dalmanni]